MRCVCLHVCLPVCLSPRKHVGGVHAERGDHGERGPAVRRCSGSDGELWHVCDGRHRHVIHASGRDLLSLRYRYDIATLTALTKT